MHRAFVLSAVVLASVALVHQASVQTPSSVLLGGPPVDAIPLPIQVRGQKLGQSVADQRGVNFF